MIHIVSDSSTMYSPEQAEELKMHVLPLQVVIDQKVYEDLVDIQADTFQAKITGSNCITTSQPSLGLKIDLYNQLLENPEDEILDLCMAQGLSGTYDSACIAKNSCDDPQRVTVFNTQTLCGPHRDLALQALSLRDQGYSALAIVERLKESVQHEISMLCVEDFSFLSRSGRVSKTVSGIGSFLKLKPEAIKSEDGHTLHVFKAARTWKKVFQDMIGQFQTHGVDENWKITIAHGNNEKVALKAKEALQAVFEHCSISVVPLCPMFMVHGGPGCIAFQAIQIS